MVLSFQQDVVSSFTSNANQPLELINRAVFFYLFVGNDAFCNLMFAHQPKVHKFFAQMSINVYRMMLGKGVSNNEQQSKRNRQVVQ